MSLNGLKLCKFVSRSDLVLDADRSVDFLRTYLVLQACTMLGVILSDHIPGDLNLTLTLTANSN